MARRLTRGGDGRSGEEPWTRILPMNQFIAPLGLQDSYPSLPTPSRRRVVAHLRGAAW